MKYEILAPVGDMDMLLAAVRCGANAVYLGLDEFNARRNAHNFNSESLFDAVKYCHERNVKVYLTLNTLVSDPEMEEAYNTVKTALSCNVDAFIVQDIGVAKMIRDSFPGARLHASTQCSVCTPYGFKYLKELGFTRAVLPREMSFDEIKEIHNEVDIELEMFIHGALCMSVSGQCYISSVIGSRSGNRGLCAQTCRLPFTANGEGDHVLSLKDLSLIKHIDKLDNTGAFSLKIEGRMKRPEYVAQAVTACKKAIEGTLTLEDEKNLQDVFSRSGFTDGYFTGKREDMFGYRQKADVLASTSVLKDISHIYDNENPLLPVDLKFSCKKGKEISLTISDDKNSFTVYGDIPQEAINLPLSEEKAKEKLSKFGNTQYYLRSFESDIDDGLNISVSSLNKLRRDGVELLNKQKENPIESIGKIWKGAAQSNSLTPYYTARFLNVSSIPDNHPFDELYIPINSKDEDFKKHDAYVEIPRGMFGKESELKSRLSHLKSIGVYKALCPDAGTYALAKELGFEILASFTMNVFNSNSASEFDSSIVSFESKIEDTNKINCSEKGIVGYGHIPLMLTRNCPIKNTIGCANCKKSGVLKDRKGYEFKVKCSDTPCVEILNPLPIYMGDRMHEVNVDFVHFYFTDENTEEVSKIIDLYSNSATPEFKYTRGLYYRGVQ